MERGFGDWRWLLRDPAQSLAVRGSPHSDLGPRGRRSRLRRIGAGVAHALRTRRAGPAVDAASEQELHRSSRDGGAAWIDLFPSMSGRKRPPTKNNGSDQGLSPFLPTTGPRIPCAPPPTGGMVSRPRTARAVLVLLVASVAIARTPVDAREGAPPPVHRSPAASPHLPLPPTRRPAGRVLSPVGIGPAA